MFSAERLGAAPMRRIAIVAPSERFRRVLVEVAASGTVQLEASEVGGAAEAALRKLAMAAAGGVGGDPRRAVRPELDDPGTRLLGTGAPDIDRLGTGSGVALLRGEAELERRAAMAVTSGALSAAVGWMAEQDLEELAGLLAPHGAAVAPIAVPPGADPPTLLEDAGTRRAFRPIVELYATPPYRDLDVSGIAGLTYVCMFGMMFGDVGHGSVLVLAGLVLWLSPRGLLAPFSRLWPLVLGAGLAAIGFGFAYGEAFGPTRLVPVIWLEPTEHPLTLIAAAVAGGAVLLAAAYTVGTINRWREGGPGRALVAGSGLAGTALYAGLAVIGLGWYRHHGLLLVAGAATSLVALGLLVAGLLAESAPGAGGVAEASIGAFDVVVRLLSNVVSFARLAAFGLTHAALCALVLSAAVALWHRGPLAALAAVAVAVAGNAVAFALEGLVAAVQALRLEYYELFSRIFVGEGEPFRPWYVPTASKEELP